MANIKAIQGFNQSAVLTNGAAVNKVFAAFGNNVINIDTGLGYPVNVKSSEVSMATFLDTVFLLDYKQRPISFYPSTDENSAQKFGYRNVRNPPWAKYCYPYKNRMYFFNVKFPNTYGPSVGDLRGVTQDLVLPSHSFYTDLPNGTEVQWGVSWGWAVVADFKMPGNVFVARPGYLHVGSGGDGVGFKTYGVKVGDPLYAYHLNLGLLKFTISEIISDTQVRTVESIADLDPNNDGIAMTFWAGRNWIEINTNNNDVGMGIIENNDRLLFFKRQSLHRWGGPGTPLNKIKGAPGTTSAKSIVNVGKEITVYFYGGTKDMTGFYAYDGVQSVKISSQVQPYMDAISSSFFDQVVSWREGPILRAYIGDLSGRFSSNKAFNVSMSKAVFTWHTESNAMSVDPISDVITSAGYFIESNIEKTLLGTDQGKILYTPDGYKFNTVAIPFKVETHIIYPRKNSVLNDFTRLTVIGRDLVGIRVYYKLWGTPFDVDQDWLPLGDLRHDTNELTIPIEHNKGSGIQLMFTEDSIRENTLVIEKVIIWSVARGDTFIDQNK